MKVGHFVGLAEKLADLLVHVTQEVYVWRSPAGALVLDQEVPKYQLSSVFLFHHHQLQTGAERTTQSRIKHCQTGLTLSISLLLIFSINQLFFFVYKKSGNTKCKSTHLGSCQKKFLLDKLANWLIYFILIQMKWDEVCHLAKMDKREIENHIYIPQSKVSKKNNLSLGIDIDSYLLYWFWCRLLSPRQDREILKEGHRETKKRKFTFMYRDRWALNESMISRSLWEKGLSSSGRLVWNTAMTFKNYTQLWWLHQQTTGWNQFCQRFNIIFCKQKKNSIVFLVSHD